MPTKEDNTLINLIDIDEATFSGHKVEIKLAPHAFDEVAKHMYVTKLIREAPTAQCTTLTYKDLRIIKSPDGLSM